MGELLLFLLEFFSEVILEVAGEAAISLGFESVTAPFKKAQNSSIGFSIAGIVILSSLSAALFHLMIPKPFFNPTRFHGISIVISPLLSGFLLYRYGIWRTSKGKQITRIATFWGGGLFAFTFALVRFLAVKYL